MSNMDFASKFFKEWPSGMPRHSLFRPALTPELPEGASLVRTSGDIFSSKPSCEARKETEVSKH